MPRTRNRALALSLASVVALAGCGDTRRQERYVSPQVAGSAQKINLEEVQKAFWTSKGQDFNQWMGAFEKRVNEIYEGDEVVSIDASREARHLKVTGFLEKNRQEGFQENGDERLFTLEQTGDALNDEVPYRVSGADGRPYYEGHHSLLDNPFLQMFLISHLMNNWGGWRGRYHTPPRDVVVLRDHQNRWRQTPDYQAQKTENKGFFSRFKRKASGDGYQSQRQFGNGSFSDSGSRRRSWFGGANPSAGSPRDSQRNSWGSRRSWGSGSKSSWGGRRSSGGGRSWGGRRR